MTERQKNTTPQKQQLEQPLTTADMAAAAEQRRQSEADQQPRLPQDTVPMMDPRASAQTAEQPIQLIAAEELPGLRSRWDSIQTSFVDEPRRAVEQADSLVADTMQRLAQLFAD